MKTILNIILLFTVRNLIAQDQLFKKDKSTLEVKVLEINSDLIKYKLNNHLDGPVYVIEKSEVLKIIYKNGSVETFNVRQKKVSLINSAFSIREVGQEESGRDLQNQDFYRFYALRNDSVLKAEREAKFKSVTKYENVLFLNLTSFFNSNLGVSYLKEFYNNRFDLHIPLSFSYREPEMINSFNSNFKINKTEYDLGLGLYFNTSGRRKITHFVGPLVRYARHSCSSIHSTYNFQTQSYITDKQEFKLTESSLLLNTGFLYRFTSRFNMMISVAAGYFFDRKIYSDQVLPLAVSSAALNNRTVAFQAGLNFGYRF